MVASDVYRSGAPLWIALSVCIYMSVTLISKPHILLLIHFTDIFIEEENLFNKKNNLFVVKIVSGVVFVFLKLI